MSETTKRGGVIGKPSPMKKEPEGLSKNQRLFRRAVINSGMTYPDFAKAIGWEGTRETLAARVQFKCRGIRAVMSLDLRLIKDYGEKIGQDLFAKPDPAVVRERLSRGDSNE